VDLAIAATAKIQRVPSDFALVADVVDARSAE
jgi:hypothetical protein